MKNDKNYKYTRLINQLNADYDDKNQDGGPPYDSADHRYSKFKCSPNESTTCNNDEEGSAVSDEKEELSEESSFLDSNGILKRYYNNTQYRKKILIGIRAKDFRKYLHLYKSSNTSTNNTKFRSSIKYSRSWTPIFILILFGFLIVIIAILEIFIIHYAHRFGAGYGSSGKTFFSKGVPWGRPSSQIGQTDIDYRYYYADNNDDVVVANSQNQNGANKFHGRPPPGSAGDRVRSKNVYNYINYNFEQPSPPLSNDMIFNSNTNNKISSKQIAPHNVFPKQKIPIFVGIERYSKSNEELKEKSPSMHSSHQSQQHQFKDLRNNDDMMFEKAKSLLLLNNKIPKVMPAKSKILSMESVEKSNSNNKNNNNSNKLGIYLGGEGRLRQQIYKSYKTNGMIKERIVFYSPFQTFDILSLLPRGLKPSIYYNYLLMKQKRNEKRFKEIMEIETENLEKFCRNQEQDNLHCGHSYSGSKTSFRPYHSLNTNSLALTTNLKMCPQIPKSFESPQSIVGEANERSFKDLEKNIHENNIATAASGGSSRPKHCIARHKLAVIIPFRDRQEHLFLLLNQLHPFLQKQELFYRVYVVEQYGSNLFNKAMLMNAGFKEAFMDSNFHCYVFHDVDLIPEISLNMYSCPKQPRHLSVAIDEMDYKLKYQMLVGGVLMFKPEHFVKVNGYSGLYWGWGAEDDDMAFRIQHVNLHITRPLESLGRYHMIKHVKRKPIALHKRYKLLSLGTQRIQIDGLNSISYTVINRTEKALYTHLLIDIGKPPQGYK